MDEYTLKSLTHQYESLQYLLFSEVSEIKEEIPEEVMKLIAGTVFNLTFQHKKIFSIPKQVAAKYLYALVNTQFYFPEVAML